MLFRWTSCIIMKLIHFFVGKQQDIKAIKVNSGWSGLGLWNQSYKHIVKLTIAGGLAHAALSRLMIDADDWNQAVCALSGHSCPSLTERFFSGQVSFCSENLWQWASDGVCMTGSGSVCVHCVGQCFCSMCMLCPWHWVMECMTGSGTVCVCVPDTE